MRSRIVTIAAAIAILGLRVAAAQADESTDAVIANLQKAYTGESNAKVRYLEFAVKADAEGYKSVSALFRAAADSEAIHATKFAETLTKLGAVPKAEMEKPVVKSTKENLEEALKGETAEKDTIYPAFAKQAEQAKQASAAMFFKSAMAAETEHAKFYQQALDKMDDWKAAGKVFAVCQVCGYTVMGDPPLKCIVCAAPREKFKVIK